MRDSYLNLYHGPIRGGKTASMTADLFIDMINGRRVFTNYPIAFDYRPDTDTPLKHYESEELNTDELLMIDDPVYQKKYTNCCIGWDEGALSLPAREHASAQNKLTSNAMLLRGKLEANIYFTVQYLSMWEKNMRLQIDNLIFCHDLSFKYRNLRRGTTISQAFQDISGRSTGETYEMSGRVYRQTFHAQPFWYIYDTKKTFSVVRDKISYNDVRRALRDGDYQKDNQYQLGQNDENEIILRHLLKGLEATGRLVLDQSVLFIEAQEAGFQGRPADMAVLLSRMGARINSMRRWYLEKAVENMAVLV